jgi:membrane-associated phospholipid phosphatase
MVLPFAMFSQVAWIEAFQNAAPFLAPLMIAASFLGQPEFYLLAIPLIVWCYDRSLGIRLLVLIPLSTVINAAAKYLFHSPRPYWVSGEVKALAYEPTFGNPSAHAQNTLVFFGYIGAALKKKWVMAACVAVILLVGFARIFLAVHFITDVLTGWAIGLIILLVFLQYETPVARWLETNADWMNISLALGASLVLVAAAWLCVAGTESWVIPGEWPAMAFAHTGVPIDPLSLKDSLLSAGLLFGSAAGAVVCSRYFPYRPSGSPARKIARYIIGIVVLGLLWVALGAITPAGGYGAGIMNYLRAAVVGAWITLGAPVLFIKLRVMARDEK